MNKELQETAVSLLAKLPEIMEKGKVYGGDLFIRFTNYAIVHEVFNLLLGISFGISCFFLFRMVRDGLKKDENSGDVSFVTGILAILFTAALLFVIGIVPDAISNIVKLIYVPELYIIDYFK